MNEDITIDAEETDAQWAYHTLARVALIQYIRCVLHLVTAKTRKWCHTALLIVLFTIAHVQYAIAHEVTLKQ